MSEKTRVYLDYAATTPLSTTALSAMRPFFSDYFGNADSPHGFGGEAARGLDTARREIAKCVNAEPSEIFFTSGGTEANNWAIAGTLYAYRIRQLGDYGMAECRVLTSSIEHQSVLKSAEIWYNFGELRDEFSTDKLGRITPAELEAMYFEPGFGYLVSIMLANNEIGTIQPIAELTRIAKKQNIPFHCDAVAAAGNIPIDVKALGVDMLTLSAHKFYGPKGIGALYIRKGLKYKPHSIIVGGQQERSGRGGTVNVAGAVGMAAALAESVANMSANQKTVSELRKHFIAELTAKIPDIMLNGDPVNGLKNIVSVSFHGITGGELVPALDLANVAVSAGAACSSGSAEVSPVLLAIGLDEKTARGTVRFSLSHLTTKEELNFAIGQIVKVVQKLRTTAV